MKVIMMMSLKVYYFLKLDVSILVQYLTNLSVADATEEFSPGGILSDYLTLCMFKFWSERYVGADKFAFSVRDMPSIDSMN